MGQNLGYLFGVGYPPKVIYFKRLFGCSADWDQLRANLAGLSLFFTSFASTRYLLLVLVSCGLFGRSFLLEMPCMSKP